MKIRGLGSLFPGRCSSCAALGWVSTGTTSPTKLSVACAAGRLSRSAGGASVQIERIVRHGFPVLMRLELQGMSYAAARGGWRAETERADLHVNVWNPNHVTLEAKAPIAIARANGATTNVTADALIATMRTKTAHSNGRHRSGQLVLDDPAEEGVLHADKGLCSTCAPTRAWPASINSLFGRTSADAAAPGAQFRNVWSWMCRGCEPPSSSRMGRCSCSPRPAIRSARGVRAAGGCVSTPRVELGPAANDRHRRRRTGRWTTP